MDSVDSVDSVDGVDGVDSVDGVEIHESRECLSRLSWVGRLSWFASCQSAFFMATAQWILAWYSWRDMTPPSPLRKAAMP